MVEYRLVHLVRLSEMFHQVQWKKPSIEDLLMGQYTLRPISVAHHQPASHVTPRKPYRAVGKKAKPVTTVESISVECIVPVEQIRSIVTRYVDGTRVEIV